MNENHSSFNTIVNMSCETVSRNESYYKSLERVQNYPIVNDSLKYALGCYQWIKSSNRILDNTLSIAETTLKTVKNTAEPLAVKPLGLIDNVVFNQLDRLERSYPIILESSDVIVDIPNKVYHTNVEPAVKRVMWPVTTTMRVVSSTSNLAMSAVSSVMTSSIQKVIPSTLTLTQTSNNIFDKTDQLLDKYLPDLDESNDEKKHCTDIQSRVKQLSLKTQRRLHKRVSKQIQVLVTSTMKKLKQVQSLIQEIQKKKEDCKLAVLEGYCNTMSSIRDRLPSSILRTPNLLSDVLQYSERFQNLVSKSANITTEYLFTHVLNGLDVLNDNLLKLEGVLKESKPEFIRKDILIYTADTLKSIHFGLDSFIHNMRNYLSNKSEDQSSEESEETEHIEEIEKKEEPEKTEDDTSESYSSSSDDDQYSDEDEV